MTRFWKNSYDAHARDHAQVAEPAQQSLAGATGPWSTLDTLRLMWFPDPTLRVTASREYQSGASDLVSSTTVWSA